MIRTPPLRLCPEAGHDHTVNVKDLLDSQTVARISR